MKSSKINEYKNMSVEQLQKELKDLKNELFKLDMCLKIKKS